MKSFLYIFLFFMVFGCVLQPNAELPRSVQYVYEPTPEPTYDGDYKFKLSIKTGEKKHLREVLDQFYDGIENDFFENQFEWVVSDPNIANVYNFYLFGRQVGKVTLVAKDRVRGSFFRVTVSVVENIYCKYITLSHNQIKIKPGQAFRISAVAYMSDDTKNSNFMWDSLDETVCRVDSYGNITAINQGVSSVLVTYANDLKMKTSVRVFVSK